jgi:hypothetical protein
MRHSLVGRLISTSLIERLNLMLSPYPDSADSKELGIMQGPGADEKKGGLLPDFLQLWTAS